MLTGLAEQLDIPLRERNALLLAAGFAPAYAEHDLADPEMGPVREAIDRVLAGHDPYPALVVDRHWGLVAGNRALEVLTAGAAEHLLEPPVNALRLSLHPEGMAPRIVNLGEWRAHILEGLGRRAVVTGDPALFALHEELAAYPGGDGGRAAEPRRRRDRDPAAPARRRGGARLPQHPDPVRDRGRRHRLGALDRVLLPRRLAHGRVRARRGGRLSGCESASSSSPAARTRRPRSSRSSPPTAPGLDLVGVQDHPYQRTLPRHLDAALLRRRAHRAGHAAAGRAQPAAAPAGGGREVGRLARRAERRAGRARARRRRLLGRGRGDGRPAAHARRVGRRARGGDRADARCSSAARPCARRASSTPPRAAARARRPRTRSASGSAPTGRGCCGSPAGSATAGCPRSAATT